MKIKFFYITLVAILCLIMTAKVLTQDYYSNSKSSQNKSIISYDNSGDLSNSYDFSDCKNCGSHCHHNHLNFTSLTKPLTINSATIEASSFNLVSTPPLQINPPQKPPKIVS